MARTVDFVLLGQAPSSSSDSVVAWVQSARRRRFDPPATRYSTGGPGLQLGDRTPAGSVK